MVEHGRAQAVSEIVERRRDDLIAALADMVSVPSINPVYDPAGVRPRPSGASRRS